MPLTFQFFETLPANIDSKPILISGKQSAGFRERIFLARPDLVGGGPLYEIRYEFNSGPFSEALEVEDLVAVGHSDRFYLFDRNTNQNILNLQLFGYFSEMKVAGDNIYVADAGHVHSIGINGSINWKSPDLGIDGINISLISETQIFGSGEWDPPGGWVKFTLDRETGDKIF